MLKKAILFTFDYELYLGENSGNCFETLIQPTKQLIDILNSCNLKGIFFVDTLYLWQLSTHSNNPTLKQDLVLVNNQLIEAIKEGHYVFPHIHPHWLDAKFDNDIGSWNLQNVSKYRFHNTSTIEKEFCFNKSIEIISTLYTNAGVKQGILGYRAGGWCIQPFSDFEPFFNSLKIKHDFSVLPGFYNLDSNQFFNFKTIKEKNVYKFDSSDITIADANGEFYEWPISTLSFSVFQLIINRFFDKILWKMKIRALGKGIGAKLNPNLSAGYIEMVSIELLTLVKIRKYLSYISNSEFTHFISHPKMISNHNLKTFKILIRKLIDNYQIESDLTLIMEKIENK